MSFPITGWGRPSLGDGLQLHLRYFGSTIIDRSWSHRHRAEPHWRLYCNLDPGAAIRCGGCRYDLAPETVWLVPPWIDWSAECRGRVRHINAHFVVPAWSRERCLAAFPIPRRVTAVDPAALVATVRELTSAGADAERSFRVIGRLAAAMAEACAALPPPTRAGLLDEHAELDALRAMIEYHLDGDCSNPALAAFLGLSEPTLTRRFRSALGTSPARYVAERRVARAAELLAAGEESIERIAERCGFGNRHYFTRAFTRLVGTSPGRYRRADRA